jgi:hypothetical protein
MHAAPSVRVRLGRAWGWPLFCGVTAGLAGANLTAWAMLRWEMRPVLAAALAVGLLAAAVAMCWAQRAQAEGDLSWDGAQWQWHSAAGQVQVALDLGHWLLLRFDTNDGSRRWLAASRGATAGPWPALRAALYSRRPADPIDLPPA